MREVVEIKIVDPGTPKREMEMGKSAPVEIGGRMMIVTQYQCPVCGIYMAIPHNVNYDLDQLNEDAFRYDYNPKGPNTFEEFYGIECPKCKTHLMI